MANVTSGSYTFDKTFAIDDIIEDAYERILPWMNTFLQKNPI